MEVRLRKSPFCPELTQILDLKETEAHYGKSLIMAHLHTVAIWTFPFHKISGFVRVILKGNFKQLYRPKVSTFLSENSDLLFSFSFYFLQNLSNPLLFAHCCCYSKELTCLNCNLMQKSQFKYVNSLE